MRSSVSRDMRRSGSSALKVEGERFLVGPPKRFLDVKLERTQDVHGAEGKPKLLGESAAGAFRDILGGGGSRCERFLVSSDGLERMKTELREDVSGQSSGSDTESDSDAPTEVNMSCRRTGVRAGPPCSQVSPLQDKASSSSSEDDSDSSQEVDRLSSQQKGSGHTIQLDQCSQKLRHKEKPLKR